MKNINNIKNKSNNLKNIFIIFSIIFFLINLSFISVFADANSDILKVINNNYLASQNGDVDAYIETMDTIFLDISSPDYFSYRDYFRGTFEVIDTIDYNINNPKIELMPNSALVFYNLKATIKNKETNEIKNIDNDVVTFLWNYDGKWKIRWSLTQSLYQLKAEAGLLSNVAVDMTLEDLDEVTLKQKAIDEGVYIELKDKLLSEDDNMDKVNTDYEGDVNSIVTDDVYSSDYSSDDYSDEDDEDSSINWFWAFIFCLIVYFIFFRKTKEKKNNEHNNKKQNIKKKNNNNNNKDKKTEKTGIVQGVLGKMYAIQEQMDKKDKILDKKTGLTRAERDINKYNRDLMFEEEDRMFNESGGNIDDSDDNNDSGGDED